MPQEICRIIGTNIRSHRKARNWTLNTLARSLGVSYQQVQKYEKGTNRIPSDMLVHVAGIFSCSLDELCGLKPESFSPEMLGFIGRIKAIQPEELRATVFEIARVLAGDRA